MAVAIGLTSGQCEELIAFLEEHGTPNTMHIRSTNGCYSNARVEWYGPQNDRPVVRELQGLR